MEEGSLIKKFIDYINGIDILDHNPVLPFGGIREDAPPDAKKAYEEYLIIYKENERQGIRT